MSVSSALRVGIARLYGANPQVVLVNAKCCQIQIRCISSKEVRQKEARQKPAPYPYNHKRYTYFHSLFDKTSRRFDENTKVSVKFKKNFERFMFEYLRCLSLKDQLLLVNQNWQRN